MDGGIETRPAGTTPFPPVRDTSTKNTPFDRRSPLLLWLFRWYLHWFFWRRFSGVRLSRAGMPANVPGRPIVVYTNHPSWWDPILMMLISPKLFPDRLGFGPIDAQALGRYGLFRRFGAFGVERGPRGAAQFLRTARAGLSDPRAILWMTAEGEFTDARRRPIALRPGIAHLARHVPDAVFLPAAFDYVFWNEARPEALIRFGPPVKVAGLSVEQAQAALEKALTQALDALAQDGSARDPAGFVTLLHGAGGVGALYDTWRRMLAFTQGKRFNPRHEAD
jgi:1-acyl-sn-glycerol-3-phosphate acyltransferase